MERCCDIQCQAFIHTCWIVTSPDLLFLSSHLCYPALINSKTFKIGEPLCLLWQQRRGDLGRCILLTVKIVGENWKWEKDAWCDRKNRDSANEFLCHPFLASVSSFCKLMIMVIPILSCCKKEKHLEAYYTWPKWEKRPVGFFCWQIF